MALQKRTVRDQVEITRDGTVQVRLALQVVDGPQVITQTYHRFSIPPGYDVKSCIDAVNADITTRPDLMADPIDKDDAPMIHAVCGLVHTKPVVDAHKKKIADALARVPL